MQDNAVSCEKQSGRVNQTREVPTPVRIAALSDTHGNAVAFEAILADLNRQSPDALVFLGDIIMRGPQPKECLEMVRALNCQAVVVGNYDNLHTRFPKPGWTPHNRKEGITLRAFDYDMARLSDADRAWLAGLPLHLTLDWAGTQVEICHATPHSRAEDTWPWAQREELDRLRTDRRTALTVIGHMHHSFTRMATAHQVLCPGSIGAPFDGDNRASYAIVDVEPNAFSIEIRRVAYAVERTLAIARERQMPDIDALEYGLTTAQYPYVEYGSV